MKKILLITTCLLVASLTYASSKPYNFLVGTYTVSTSSQGIYSLYLDVDKGVFETKLQSADVTNPSFLAISKDKKQVFAVSELGESSSVSSFQFDKKTAALTAINTVCGVGADPCYITMSKTHLFTANYTAGSINVLEHNNQGSITGIVQTIQHGSKESKIDNQVQAHVHQTLLSKNGKYLLVNDLGLDKLMLYKYRANTTNSEIITAFDSLSFKKGSGPRHLTFSPNGKYIYLLHELDGTVSVIRYQNGTLTLIAETTVVRKSNISTGAADIHLSPDGKFLYATNRGTANDITCFAIQKDGKLVFVEQISVEGTAPRNFSITKDGRYLLVANQVSNQIVLFERDKKSGKLRDTGLRADLGAPVCIQEY